MKTTLVILATLAAGMSANAAFATPAGEQTQQIVVHFKDLDLSHPEDVNRLYSRIKGAADQVCGENQPESLAAAQHYRNCVNAAVEDAVAKINATRERKLAQGI